MPADPTGTLPPGGDTSAADTMAEIVFLAQFIADELELTFADPVDEFFFFLAVADLYFQVQRQQRFRPTDAGPVAAADGDTRRGSGRQADRRGGNTSRRGSGTLGSLTAVGR